MRSSFPRLSLLLVLPLLLGARWPDTPDSGLALHVDPAVNTIDLRVVEDGAGGMVAFWYPLHLQRYDRSGTPVWGADPIDVANPALGPRVFDLARSATGEFITLWGWFDNGRYRPTVMKIDPDGQLLWPAGGIAVSDSAVVGNMDLIARDDGGALVVWMQGTIGNFDLYMNGVSPAGFVWDGAGEEVCTVLGDQRDPRMVSDSQGGAFVVWEDFRGFDGDIYAQHMLSTGSPAWDPSGVAVCTFTDLQFDPRLVSDGAGGIIVCWADRRPGGVGLDRVFVQRVSGAGGTLWTSDGIPVTTSTNTQGFPDLVSDGAGGAVVAWYIRNPFPQIRAQRIDPNGNLLWGPEGVLLSATFSDQPAGIRIIASGDNFLVSWDNQTDDHIEAQLVDLQGNVLWPAAGLDLCTHPATQSDPLPVPDGRGGGYIVWRDDRSGLHDPYGSHVYFNGSLGYLGPDITSLVDFPADQGSQVILSWSPSSLDRFGNMGMAEYWTWRRYPGAAAAGTSLLAGNVPVLPLALREVPEAQTLAASGWEFVGTTPPMDLDEYADTVPTYGDSTDTGIQWTEFMVSAYVGPGEFYESGVMSGYSIDNVPPQAPQNLAVDYGRTVNHLVWEPSEDTDIRAFRIYRSQDPDFVPAPGDLLGETADLNYADVVADPFSWHYKVSEVDMAGNEGPAATVSQVTGTPEASSVRTVLLPPHPNPFRAGTTVGFALAQDQDRVRVTVHDATGRRIRTLHRGPLPAGVHRWVWDGATEFGIPSRAGIYFLHVAGGEASYSTRVLRLR